jgi:molybdate transport system permease protein
VSRRHARAGGLFSVAVIPAALLTAFLALPVLALAGRSFAGGRLADAIGRPAWDALVLSLFTTGVTVTVAVLLGTPLALVLARRAFPGRALVEVIVDLPIVLPPSVAGLALLFAFGRRGVLGAPLSALGIEIPFTTLAVIVAQLFVAAPLYVRAARAGFATVDRSLEDAARVDGAGEVTVFRTVTAPLAGSALAAGLVLAWARAMGEFGATIMFAGNLAGVTQTLPLVVYGEFQSSLDSSVAAAFILVVVAFAVLGAVRFTHWRSVLDMRAVG